MPSYCFDGAYGVLLAIYYLENVRIQIRFESNRMTQRVKHTEGKRLFNANVVAAAADMFK